jgi:hypothetical protein
MAQRTVKNPPYGYKFNNKVVDDITELYDLSGGFLTAETQSLQNVLAIGNNTGVNDIIMGTGTSFTIASEPGNTIQMDLDWDGDPSIRIGNGGFLQVASSVLLESGDAANLFITDTADFNTDLYLKRDAGSGTSPRSINTRSNIGLNIGNVSGTVSVGNATYPTIIKGGFSLDDHATFDLVDDAFGKGIILKDGVTGDNNIRLTDETIYINVNAAGISNGGLLMYGTSGKTIEFNNATANDRILINANTQPFSAQGSSSILASTTGTSALTLAGNTASFTGALIAPILDGPSGAVQMDAIVQYNQSYPVLEVYTTISVPSPVTAGAGALVYISNETGGPTIAFSDGANWKRVQDLATIVAI